MRNQCTSTQLNFECLQVEHIVRLDGQIALEFVDNAADYRVEIVTILLLVVVVRKI